MTRTLTRQIACIVCAFAALSIGAEAASAAQPLSTVTTSQQGMHQWSVTGGRLILIAGTDADTTSYKRSFTFYFQESADASWNHVPIVESSIDFTKTWFSVSRGESTLADAVVIAKEGSVRLITASREKSGLAIKVARYLLVQDDVAFPDGPGHVFKKISSESIPITRGQTIAHVLIQEAAMARKN